MRVSKRDGCGLPRGACEEGAGEGEDGQRRSRFGQPRRRAGRQERGRPAHARTTDWMTNGRIGSGRGRAMGSGWGGRQFRASCASRDERCERGVQGREVRARGAGKEGWRRAARGRTERLAALRGRPPCSPGGCRVAGYVGRYPAAGWLAGGEPAARRSLGRGRTPLTGSTHTRYLRPSSRKPNLRLARSARSSWLSGGWRWPPPGAGSWSDDRPATRREAAGQGTATMATLPRNVRAKSVLTAVRWLRANERKSGAIVGGTGARKRGGRGRRGSGEEEGSQAGWLAGAGGPAEKPRAARVLTPARSPPVRGPALLSCIWQLTGRGEGMVWRGVVGSTCERGRL